MRKKLFLFTLLIVGLVSCNLDSKLLLGDKEKTKVEESVKGSAKDVVINTVQGDKPTKTKEEGNEVSVREDEREQLISALIYDVDNVSKMVSEDKVAVEDESQYGMKDEVFKAVTDAC